MIEKISGRIMPCLLLLVCLLIYSCRPEYLNKQELNSFILDESNGLLQEKQVGGIGVKVTYKPTDLLIAQHLGDNMESSEIERLRAHYGQYVYFMLDLESGGQDILYAPTSGGSGFSEKLQTFAFRMTDYVNLTTSASDTIPVADYAYNRTFGMAKNTSMMFVFNREQIENKDWISFNLNESGIGSGDQRFRFKTSNINNVPKLKFFN